MSYFNELVYEDTPRTYEGGKASNKSLEDEWTNILFSSFLQNGFYEGSEDFVDRLQNLNEKIILKYGTEFAGKAMNYVRNTLGMRTTSALLAAQLNSYQFNDKRNIFANYFHRPDDVSEVFAAIDKIGGKRSHALIRGAADYLSSLNDYTLGKYKLSGHTYNMFDLINLTHAHSTSIQKYKDGVLENPETWEVLISTAEDKDEREKNWSRLVREDKLGYLALLRNLRNIFDVVGYNDFLEHIVYKISNRELVKKSLVFPYQIYVAYNSIKNMWESNNYMPTLTQKKKYDAIIAGLNNAFVYSVDNVPALEGNNCVILDVSGSMTWTYWTPSITVAEASAVYATAILLKNLDNCTVIKFATDAERVNLKEDVANAKNIFDVIYSLTEGHNLGGGTNINSVVPLLENDYDAIFLFSDEQVADSNRSFVRTDSFDGYVNKFSIPVFSFDLGSYRTRVAVNKENYYPISSLSPMVFEFIKMARAGKTLVDMINES